MCAHQTECLLPAHSTFAYLAGTDYTFSAPQVLGLQVSKSTKALRVSTVGLVLAGWAFCSLCNFPALIFNGALLIGRLQPLSQDSAANKLNGLIFQDQLLGSDELLATPVGSESGSQSGSFGRQKMFPLQAFTSAIFVLNTLDLKLSGVRLPGRERVSGVGREKLPGRD